MQPFILWLFCHGNERVFVYVDGFNLYHAIKDLNEPHLKWVDLWKLSENLVINRKNEIIHEVKYFTAYLKEKEEKYRRHSDYVSALKAKNVTPVIGNFKDKFITCRECNHQYKTVEEKQTDYWCTFNSRYAFKKI